MSCRFIPPPVCSSKRLLLVILFALVCFASLSRDAASQAIQLNTGRQNTIFPTTVVGTTSSSVNIPLGITFDGTVISSISAPMSASGKQEFTIQSIGCALNVSLSAGTTCNIAVTFSPSVPGNRTTPLEVQSSAGNFNFGMEGVGHGSQVALSPATIATFAGNGSETLSGDNGTATTAGVPLPLSVALDSAENIYIVDGLDSVVRKIAAKTGIISTMAGSNGNPGFSGDHGPARYAQLNGPTGIAIDSAGNIYIADSGSSFVRKVSAATGDISTVVGIGRYVTAPGIPPQIIPPTGYLGDGSYATGAWMNSPSGLAFDNADDLYIADTGNNVIRRVDAVTNIITTVAGDHKQGYSGDGGPALGAELNQPSAVAVDDSGNIFIADLGNNVIRRVDGATGMISTEAGNGTPGYSGDGGPAANAELNHPAGVSVDGAGNIYIVDSGNSRVREVFAQSGTITTIAGDGTAGFSGDGSSASAAGLNYPNGLSMDSFGNLYIADSLNNRIREVNILDSEMNFATTPIGFSSLDSPQTASVTNTGNAPLLFSVPSSGLNPSISTNFTLSPGSTCPQLDITSAAQGLAPGGSCNLLVSFTPIETGPIAGTVNIADNAMSTPPFVQTIHLNGTGLPASAGRPDFAVSVSPSSQSISTNSPSAAYTVTVTEIYGFTGTVSLSATDLPAGVNASFSPASVDISGSNASSTFTVTMSSKQAMLPSEKNYFPGETSALRYGFLLLSFPILGVAGKKKLRRSMRQKRLFTVLVAVCLGAAAFSLTGCANIGLELGSQTYNITITGTSTGLQRSASAAVAIEQYTKIKYH